MSINWQIGDLALCIKVGPWVSKVTHAPRPDCPIKGGMFCKVRRIGFFEDILVLWFEEDLRCDSTLSAYKADRFVRIPPEEADEFDKETIELYNKKPTKEFI